MATTIQPEVWIAEIEKNLYKNRDWLKLGKIDDEYIGKKRVTLPQAGNRPNVEMNRATLPATITSRNDTVIDYAVQEFTADPTLIEDVDEVETSYNKRQDIIEDHLDTLPDRLADYAAYVYATGADQIQCTGAGRIDEGGVLTGQRHSVAAADISKAMTKMSLQKVPRGGGRFFIMDPMAWSDLLNDDKLSSREYTEKVNLEKGTLGTLYGFDVYESASVAFHNPASGGSIIAPGSIIPGTAERVCLLLHEKFIRRAMGQIKLYSDIDKPEYYGSVLSTRIRFGCSRARTNGDGVISLLQGTV